MGRRNTNSPPAQSPVRCKQPYRTHSNICKCDKGDQIQRTEMQDPANNNLTGLSPPLLQHIWLH